jgi:hypothetical protein
LELLTQGSVLDDGLLPHAVQVVVATEKPLVDGVFDWGILNVMAILRQSGRPGGGESLCDALAVPVSFASSSPSVVKFAGGGES